MFLILFYPFKSIKVSYIRIGQYIFITFGMCVEINRFKYLIVSWNSTVDRFAHKPCLLIEIRIFICQYHTKINHTYRLIYSNIKVRLRGVIHIVHIGMEMYHGRFIV